MQNEIVEAIKSAEIDCPDCEYMSSDDQYTCTTCWCQGGNGKLNVFDYIKANREILNT